MAEYITLNHWSESEELARALRRRDPEVLDLLIERYQFRLLRYLTTLTRDRHSAEDLFQETWIRVLERCGQYNGKSRSKPGFSRLPGIWLLTNSENRRHPSAWKSWQRRGRER